MASRAEIAPARTAAFHVLLRVFEEGAYADRALRSAVSGLDERERALAHRLSFGAVQRVRTLDHAIEDLGRRPVARLDPPVRAALRLGAYQLGFVDGVPRYAAVNESVELVRAAGLERAVAFTNAVLRRLADGMQVLLDGLGEETPADAALKHSYPDWVAETWWRDLGAAGALALMRAQNEPAELVVRLVRGEIDGRPDPEIPGACHVERIDETALAEGRIWPQSRASQLVGLAVGSHNGERTLDLCAAPGGKATMLAGEVVAVEVNEARARELAETVSRLGAANVRVVVADGRALPARAPAKPAPSLSGGSVEPTPLPARAPAKPAPSLSGGSVEPAPLPPELDGFDRALVDAPCSGLGVLNQRPDLRWRAEPLAELQLDLLRAAATRVRPGGTVVYSVCTINADEAEAVVDASGLDVDPSLSDEWPQFRHPSRPEFLLTLPHVHGTAGFFVARLRA